MEIIAEGTFGGLRITVHFLKRGKLVVITIYDPHTNEAVERVYREIE